MYMRLATPLAMSQPMLPLLSLRGGQRTRELNEFDLFLQLVEAAKVPGLSRVVLIVLAAVFVLQLVGVVNDDSWAHNERQVQRGEWYRLSSCTFLHADFQHLALNALFLASITPSIEKMFGTVDAVTIFLLSGIAGSCGGRFLGYNFVPRLEIALLNCLSEFGIGHRRSHLPVDDGSTMSVGASGAAYGYNGALIGACVRNPGQMGLVAPIFYLAYHFASDVLRALCDGERSIDHAAHIAGGLSGALLGCLLSPNARRPGPDGWLVLRSLLARALAIGLHVAALLKATQSARTISLPSLPSLPSWLAPREKRSKRPRRAVKKKRQARKDAASRPEEDVEVKQLARRIEKLERELAEVRRGRESDEGTDGG